MVSLKRFFKQKKTQKFWCFLGLRGSTSFFLKDIILTKSWLETIYRVYLEISRANGPRQVAGGCHVARIRQAAHEHAIIILFQPIVSDGF